MKQHIEFFFKNIAFKEDPYQYIQIWYVILLYKYSMICLNHHLGCVQKQVSPNIDSSPLFKI